MNFLNLSSEHPTFFDIVQIGAGGNGAYLTQRLSKLLSNFNTLHPNDRFAYTIVDGDVVEENNLTRQPFLMKDVHQHKAEALSKRYGRAYSIPIHFYNTYIEKDDDLEAAFFLRPGEHANVLRIIIGAVDNHASRKIMGRFFNGQQQNLIYMDVGIDSVVEHEDVSIVEKSGYSGHCILGLRTSQEVIFKDVTTLYPSIAEDTESKLPSQSCSATAVYEPQRMQTNEYAALVANGYMNQILLLRKIYAYETHFN
ncbi:MAG: ThiF family adenylyltransferase, partial [Bacilli bacterium]